MYTKIKLKDQIRKLGVRPDGTLFLHSAMKAVGNVEGGADTVLDAFSEYLSAGLLVLPTHTWDTINLENTVFDVLSEPSCVGLLTNLFRKRPGVLRSWHPTHSMAALGEDAAQFVQGEEHIDTPCGRGGCYGKLYDRNAQILFLGVDLSRNTIIHGVEEWVGVPNRLSAEYAPYKIRTPDDRILERPMRRHAAPISDLSANYVKLTEPLLQNGIAVQGRIGNAQSILVHVRPMVELTKKLLRLNPDLFLDNDSILKEWYEC